MAARNYSIIQNYHERFGVYIVQWTGLLNGDTGVPFPCPGYNDKSVQVSGTFGSGGNCKIEGANDPATPVYALLNDSMGVALNVGAAKIAQVLENPYVIRPNISAGDGTTSLTVTAVIKG
jgi:hypothetical protein